ncbi:hypothetical protein D3C80_345610 [compost metagenome]
MRVVAAHAFGLALAEGFAGHLPEGLGQGGRGGQQLLLVAGDEAGVQLGVGEGRVGQYATEEGQVGLEAAHGGFVEHGQQALAGFLAGLAPGDQLGQHGVVEGRYLVAFGNPAVHPAAGAGGGFAVQCQAAAGGEEVLVRVFGVQAHFDGVAIQRHLFLGDGQGLATGDADLPGHQVEAGDGFGDRVLHLQAGVHLHEEEVATLVQQEFHGAGTDVADGLGGAHGGLAHGPAQFRREAGGRRFFHHLLVAALDRAVALVEVQAVAVAVGEHLDFHVARLEDVFLHQHARVAEGGLGFTLGGGQGLGQFAFPFHYFHALAATAGGGLQQHRVADAFGAGAEGFQVLGLAVVAGHQGHAGGFHQGLRGGLAAHGVDGGGRRAEEDQPGLGDGAGEAGVLREETVAGVDGLGAAGLGGGDQLVHQQVAFRRLGAAQVDGDVGLAHVAGVAVDGAVHGHGADTQGLGGAHDAAGDFTAVGDQQGSDHCYCSCQDGLRFSRKARRPSWPSGLTRMRAMALSV